MTTCAYLWDRGHCGCYQQSGVKIATIVWQKWPRIIESHNSAESMGVSSMFTNGVTMPDFW
jgi:hypothetical protein